MANWIAGAISHPGAFKKQAESAGESTAEYAQEKKHASGKTGARARLALTLMHMRRTHSLKKKMGGK